METNLLIALVCIISMLMILLIYCRHKITKVKLIIEEQKEQIDFLLMLSSDAYSWSSVSNFAKKLNNLEKYHNSLVRYFLNRLLYWESFSVGCFLNDTKTELSPLRLAFDQAVRRSSPQRMAIIVIDSLKCSKDAEVYFTQRCGAEFLLNIVSKQARKYKTEFQKEASGRMEEMIDKEGCKELLEKIKSI